MIWWGTLVFIKQQKLSWGLMPRLHENVHVSVSVLRCAYCAQTNTRLYGAYVGGKVTDGL